MNRLIIAALIAAHVAAVAAPARAAEIVSAEMPRSLETGTFVGVRFRLPLDGARRVPRTTLTAAPALRSTQSNGESRLRIGRGIEFGLDGEEVRFDVGGQPVSRLVAGGEAPDGERRNISTVGWVAIGVGAVVVTVFALYALCGSGEICSVDDD